MEWIHVDREGARWVALLRVAMTPGFRGGGVQRGFLTGWVTVGFSGRTLLHGFSYLVWNNIINCNIVH
jgi:hypothetical protein